MYKKLKKKVNVMKCSRCCDSGRKDGLVEWETPDCVWWIGWSVPGGQGWKEHHRPRGEADAGMEPHAVGTDNHQQVAISQGNVPTRKGQPLVLEVERLSIKIRSFDLL